MNDYGGVTLLNYLSLERGSIVHRAHARSYLLLQFVGFLTTQHDAWKLEEYWKWWQQNSMAIGNPNILLRFTISLSICFPSHLNRTFKGGKNVLLLFQIILRYFIELKPHKVGPDSRHWFGAIISWGHPLNDTRHENAQAATVFATLHHNENEKLHYFDDGDEMMTRIYNELLRQDTWVQCGCKKVILYVVTLLIEIVKNVILTVWMCFSV